VLALLVNNFNFIKTNKLNKWKIKINIISLIFLQIQNFLHFYTKVVDLVLGKGLSVLLVNSSKYFIDMSVQYKISCVMHFEINTDYFIV
jgi:hypothetical protein